MTSAGSSGASWLYRVADVCQVCHALKTLRRNAFTSTVVPSDPNGLVNARYSASPAGRGRVAASRFAEECNSSSADTPSTSASCFSTVTVGSLSPRSIW